MCCHPVDGVHGKGEPDTCCHVHAEDAPSNLDENDFQKYDSDGWVSVADGWTAQTPVRDRIITEGMPEFTVCATCGMEIPKPVEPWNPQAGTVHECPALAGARRMVDHIPPAPFYPRPAEEQFSEGPPDHA
jgi:hypothetical protein